MNHVVAMLTHSSDDLDPSGVFFLLRPCVFSCFFIPSTLVCLCKTSGEDSHHLTHFECNYRKHLIGLDRSGTNKEFVKKHTSPDKQKY